MPRSLLRGSFTCPDVYLSFPGYPTVDWKIIPHVLHDRIDNRYQPKGCHLVTGCSGCLRFDGIDPVISGPSDLRLQA